MDPLPVVVGGAESVVGGTDVAVVAGAAGVGVGVTVTVTMMVRGTTTVLVGGGGVAVATIDGATVIAGGGGTVIVTHAALHGSTTAGSSTRYPTTAPISSAIGPNVSIVIHPHRGTCDTPMVETESLTSLMRRPDG